MTAVSTLPDRAQTVIVGAGVSAAFHLADNGVTDVLVIDQGPLFERALGREPRGHAGRGRVLRAAVPATVTTEPLLDPKND